MREIKFRAWNERKGWKNKDGSDCVPKMEYKDFVIHPDGRKEFPQGGWDLSFEDEEMILLQYTGLKDKNGKEIYEGDILNSVYRRDGCSGVYEIEWVEKMGGFWPRRRGEHQQKNVEINMYDMRWCEIIGNFYENPELLNNKE